MKTDIPSNPREIKDILADACIDVYSGLLQGSIKVKEYFDSLEDEINAPLAANLARFHAKRHIAQKRNLLTPYLLMNANNNGIAIKQDFFEIKVLKGRDGNPPCPSKSRRSERFYSQRLPEQLALIKDAFRPWRSSEWELYAASSDKLNLILCWEVDESYSITQLQLMAPRNKWKYGQSVRLFWKQRIAHPAWGMSVTDLNEQDEDFDDLDIFFDDEAESGDE